MSDSLGNQLQNLLAKQAQERQEKIGKIDYEKFKIFCDNQKNEIDELLQSKVSV